jgi:rhodanese-related sulfurtransferase
LVIAFVGLVLGLAANAVSPRGLVLTRDYFPAGALSTRALEGAAPSAPIIGGDKAPPATNTSASAPATPAHTKRGLPLASHDEVVALFRDSRYAQGLIVFIDARDESHFAAGHIPGAHLFDHYHIERYTADILAIAPLAERIVVYCNGGECEDSELTALDLLSLGVPAEKVVIYGGGIVEWKQRRMPIASCTSSSSRSTSP